MGWRFRKNTKIGPFRITASKSGISYSVGTKGYRITKTANGKIRQTVTIPGTGISYVTEETIKQKKKNFKSNDASFCIDEKKPLYPIEKTLEQKLLACLGGWLGLHYFFSKRYIAGLVYLFTCGLMCIGWFIDIYKSFTHKSYLFE